MAHQKEFPSDKADKFVVRLPDGLRDRISESAKLSKRSMNAQIIYMIEFYFQEMDRMDADSQAQKEYEEKMRSDPPEDLEPLEQLHREYFDAQIDLFHKLAKKHNIKIFDPLEKSKK